MPLTADHIRLITKLSKKEIDLTESVDLLNQHKFNVDFLNELLKYPQALVNARKILATSYSGTTSPHDSLTDNNPEKSLTNLMQEFTENKTLSPHALKIFQTIYIDALILSNATVLAKIRSILLANDELRNAFHAQLLQSRRQTPSAGPTLVAEKPLRYLQNMIDVKQLNADNGKLLSDAEIAQHAYYLYATI